MYFCEMAEACKNRLTHEEWYPRRIFRQSLRPEHTLHHLQMSRLPEKIIMFILSDNLVAI